MSSILFVDDEISILKSLESLFVETNHTIFVAESAEQAFYCLENNEINIIVSDMKMPHVDGYQLLKAVKEKYPKISRVALSSYTDEKLVFEALQKNIVKLFIFKPWEDEKILSIIQHILETEEVLSDKNLLSVINNIDQLPTIETSYQRIVHLIENDADMLMVAKEVEKDQAIAIKILRLANSAYFGIKTGSVRQAISYIGLQNTRNLVISTSIINSMVGVGKANKFIDELWQGAFKSSKMLSFIYQTHLKKKLNEASMASGLLFNIGIVFFLNSFPSKYLNIIDGVCKDGKTLIETEKEELSINHCQAGGYLLQWWELPYPIIEAALYHHTPLDSGIVNRELICAIHIVDHYVYHSLHDFQRNTFFPEVFDILEINQEEFEKSLTDFQEGFS